MSNIENHRSEIVCKLHDRIRNVFWRCLREDCPRSCCSAKFDNGTVLSWHNLQHDQIPLTIYEHSELIRVYGNSCVVQQEDGIYYIKADPLKDCIFWKDYRCTIQEIKPTLCRAYPLIDLDQGRGFVFDTQCPGFAVAKKESHRMAVREFNRMLQALVHLQEFRLSRLKLLIKEEFKVLPPPPAQS